MNRSEYFNFIEYHLSVLVTRIEMRGSLNILDLNIHAENFYMHLLNLIFDLNLKNINAARQNMAAIDLVDTKNRIIFQVTSTATRQKIESTLSKDFSIYNEYNFKFIFIAKDAKDLRDREFANPNKIKFFPAEDIFDVPSILKLILVMDADRQKTIHDFLRKELISEPNLQKVESNITTIINILSKEDLSQEPQGIQTVPPYDIQEKINFNQLNPIQDIIDEHKIHYPRIDKIYSEFDRHGKNKSASILGSIRRNYFSVSKIEAFPDRCFLLTIEAATQKIKESANFIPIPDEELYLAVEILIVDAFIRCKIFKNPSVSQNVDS